MRRATKEWSIKHEAQLEEERRKMHKDSGCGRSLLVLSQEPSVIISLPPNATVTGELMEAAGTGRVRREFSEEVASLGNSGPS